MHVTLYSLRRATWAWVSVSVTQSKMTRSNSTRSSNDRSGGAMGEDIETAKSEFRLGIHVLCTQSLYTSKWGRGSVSWLDQVSAMRKVLTVWTQLQCLLPHAHDLAFSSTLQCINKHSEQLPCLLKVMSQCLNNQLHVEIPLGNIPRLRLTSICTKRHYLRQAL